MPPVPSDHPFERPDGPVEVRAFGEYIRARTGVLWRAESGHAAIEYAPQEWRAREDLRIFAQGLLLARDEYESTAVGPGTQLLLYLGPMGFPFYILGMVAADVALGITLVYPSGWTQIYEAAFGTGRDARDADSPTYDWAGVRNTWAVGTPIQTIYGTHRVGGHIIQQFTRKARAVPAGYSNPTAGELNTLLALSTGPVDSISDLQIDKNPAADYGDGIHWLNNVRLGEDHQAPIDGFQEVVRTEFKDTVAEYVGGPVTFTTTGRVDRFELQIRFPNGLADIGEKGDLRALAVYFRIEHRALGETSWINDTPTPLTCGAATQHPRDFWWRSQLLDRAIYEIRVTRLSPDWGTPNVLSTSNIWAVNEVLEEGLTYPGIALVGIQQLPTNLISGAIPSYDVLVRGVKVYTWSGGVKSAAAAWSDNPAWCCVHRILSISDGLGAWFDESDLVMSEFEAWAAFCATNDLHLNFVDDGSQKPIDVIAQMCFVGHAAFYYVGSKWGVKIDQPADPTQFFSMGRIHKNTFSVSKASLADRPNVLIGEFSNPDLDYEPDAVRLEDPLMDPTDEPREETVSCVGCASEDAVLAILRKQLLKNRLERRAVEVELGIDALGAEVFDVVKFAHDVPGWGYSGKILRVLDENTTRIVLDREVTIEAGKDYELTVVVPGADAPDVVRVVNTPGRAALVVVDGGWTGTPPEAGADYSFGEVGESVSLYRILSITRSSDPTKRWVRAFQYDERVYEEDISAAPAPSVTRREDPRRIPSDPTSVRVNEREAYAQDGSLSIAIDVHWTMPPEAGARCQVWWRREGDPVWAAAGDPVDRGYFPITQHVEAPGTTYEVSVVPVAPAGNRKHPDLGVRASITTTGTTRQPGTILGFRADRTLEGLVFTWTPLDATTYFDLDYYEIRDGESWETGILVGRTTESRLLTTSFRQGARTFQIRGYNTAGRSSPSSTTLVLQVDGRIGENVVFTHAAGPTWTGSKLGFTINDDDYLELDLEGAQVGWRAQQVATPLGSSVIDGGFAPQFRVTGVYTTPIFEIGSTPLRCLVTTDLELEQVDLTMVWEELTTQTWGSDFAKSRTWAVIAGDKIRTKLEMRFSTTTDDESAFGAWAERAENIEILARYAQVRITATTLDPDLSVIMRKLDIQFDVPDIREVGLADTSGTGTVTVTFGQAFNAEPRLALSVIPATAGDQIFVTDKSKTGFDLAVRNAGSLVVRAVEWIAIGY